MAIELTGVGCLQSPREKTSGRISACCEDVDDLTPQGASTLRAFGDSIKEDILPLIFSGTISRKIAINDLVCKTMDITAGFAELFAAY